MDQYLINVIKHSIDVDQVLINMDIFKIHINIYLSIWVHY